MGQCSSKKGIKKLRHLNDEEWKQKINELKKHQNLPTSDDSEHQNKRPHSLRVSMKNSNANNNNHYYNSDKPRSQNRLASQQSIKKNVRISENRQKISQFVIKNQNQKQDEIKNNQEQEDNTLELGHSNQLEPSIIINSNQKQQQQQFQQQIQQQNMEQSIDLENIDVNNFENIDNRNLEQDFQKNRPQKVQSSINIKNISNSNNNNKDTAVEQQITMQASKNSSKKDTRTIAEIFNQYIEDDFDEIEDINNNNNISKNKQDNAQQQTLDYIPNKSF